MEKAWGHGPIEVGLGLGVELEWTVGGLSSSGFGGLRYVFEANHSGPGDGGPRTVSGRRIGPRCLRCVLSQTTEINHVYYTDPPERTEGETNLPGRQIDGIQNWPVQGGKPTSLKASSASTRGGSARKPTSRWEKGKDNVRLNWRGEWGRPTYSQPPPTE